MPYIYSLAGKVHFDDYTLMRPLVMDFPSDPEVGNISDQYLFGPSIMVNPVYRYKARERNVYFPGGKGWYDLHSGSYFQGGQWMKVDAPYEQIPLYVKAGAILPVGPAIQYVNEKPADPIHLFVFGGADGEFTLYEDEGLNYNYEKGDFATIVLRYDDAAKSLTVEARQGSFKGMTDLRTFHVTLIDEEHPGSLLLDARPGHTLQYDGQKTMLQL
jgi:alpha-D-xyloside xylohydrolase